MDNPSTFRVVTLNLWQEQGAWEERLDWAAVQLAELAPDAICLQEVRDAGERVPNQARRLAAELGMSCSYLAVQAWGDGQEGLAVLTRDVPAGQQKVVLPSEEGRCRRGCLGVRLQSPQGRVLWVFTTHLAWRLRDGLLRERQVEAVDAFVSQSRADSLAIIGGDFNASPECDELRFLCGTTTLAGRRTYYQDAYACCHPSKLGWTWTRANPGTKKMAWLPERRLDYVFVSAEQRDGVGRVVAADVVCDRASPAGVYCSDHFGVMAEIVVDPGDKEGP